MSLIISLFFVVASLLGGCTAVLWFFQNNLLFYPESELVTTPNAINLDYQDVKFPTSDELLLHGWYIPAARKRGTLLFMHGNAGNVSHRLESIKIFHDLGLNVFIFDYRGYGLSGGEISEPGSYRDAEAALRFLTGEKHVPLERVIIFGRSLGGSIASYLANHQKPGGLIVESTFTSVPDMAAKLYPFLPVRWISRLKYTTVEYLKNVSCPVLIIHSKDDDLIPFSHGQQLYEKANPPKRFIELEGGHNDAFMKSRPRYIEEIEKFLNQELRM